MLGAGFDDSGLVCTIKKSCNTGSALGLSDISIRSQKLRKFIWFQNEETDEIKKIRYVNSKSYLQGY